MKQKSLHNILVRVCKDSRFHSSPESSPGFITSQPSYASMYNPIFSLLVTYVTVQAITSLVHTSNVAILEVHNFP